MDLVDLNLAPIKYLGKLGGRDPYGSRGSKSVNLVMMMMFLFVEILMDLVDLNLYTILGKHRHQ